jgi:hypothetical protein
MRPKPDRQSHAEDNDGSEWGRQGPQAPNRACPPLPPKQVFEYHIAHNGVPTGLMPKGRADPPSMMDEDYVQVRGGGFGGRGTEGMECRWPPTVPLAVEHVN